MGEVFFLSVSHSTQHAQSSQPSWIWSNQLKFLLASRKGSTIGDIPGRQQQAMLGEKNAARIFRVNACCCLQIPQPVQVHLKKNPQKSRMCKKRKKLKFRPILQRYSCLCSPPSTLQQKRARKPKPNPLKKGRLRMAFAERRVRALQCSSELRVDLKRRRWRSP